MKLASTIAKILLVCLILQVSIAPGLRAQEKKPVMENVFFNVIWGSALGSLLGVATAVIGAQDHSAPDGARSAAFSGATVGGVIGLGVGLWVIYQGTTFEGSQVQIAGNQMPLPPPVFAVPVEPPLVFLTEPSNPTKIVGFRATLFRMKF